MNNEGPWREERQSTSEAPKNVGRIAAGLSFLYFSVLFLSLIVFVNQMGENARRSFFESHWMVQSYNKSIIKEEEGRVASAMSDAAVIRRGWTRNERLRAELEDAFVFLGMRPQKQRIKKNNNRRQLYDDDDDDLLIGANTTNWQIGR